MIAVDADGNVYTATSFLDEVWKTTPAGISTILGTTGSDPHAIAVDAAGNVYTANGGDRIVYRRSPPTASQASFGPRTVVMIGIMASRSMRPAMSIRPPVRVTCGRSPPTAHQRSLAQLAPIRPQSHLMRTAMSIRRTVTVWSGRSRPTVPQVFLGKRLVLSVAVPTTPGSVMRPMTSQWMRPAMSILRLGSRITFLLTVMTTAALISLMCGRSPPRQASVTYPASDDTSPITITGLTNDT